MLIVIIICTYVTSMYVSTYVVVGYLGASLIDTSYLYNLYVSNTSGATWTEVSVHTKCILPYICTYVRIYVCIYVHVNNYAYA